MNILQMLPELHVGGVETGTLDLAQYLCRYGHRAIVISNGGDLVKELESHGAKHYTLPVHRKSLWTMFRMIKCVKKIIQDEKVDIVHARSRIPAWIAYFASRKTKASFITTCHGYYNNRFFSQIMGWARIVITPSKVIARHMIDDYYVSPEAIRCIPRSVDLSKYEVQRKKRTANARPVVAIVGRLTKLKGHEFFIQAMAKVVQKISNMKIWIIGDAPQGKAFYKEELEMLVKRLGLKEHVEFLGNRRDIPKLLSQTDVLVLSTITQESFGRVILEAQAAQVPVVATEVGGVVDIIDDEKTGLLVMPKDIEAMAKSVIRLLKDRELSQSIVIEAKKKLQEKFTLEKMALSTIAAYEELLNSRNILIVKLSALGDVILITASIKAISKKFPNAKIYCLVGFESRKILQKCPYLDGLIVYDYKNKEKGFSNLLKLTKSLRKYQFDIIIDFQNNRRSHLISFLTFPKKSYGYHNGKWGFLLSAPIKEKTKNISPVAHQFEILKHLGIEYKSSTFLELWPSLKDKKIATELLDSEWLGKCNNIIGIHISASNRWRTKNWPIEYIARLCDLLSQKNLRVMLTGIETDNGLAQHLLTLTKSKPANFVGKTDILQLAALIEQCKVFVTPDSAPLHIASAMETPVVALFGPTDSVRHIPPAKKITILERKLNCQPCYSSRCRILTHQCMKTITPEEVLFEIESLIGNQN